MGRTGAHPGPALGAVVRNGSAAMQYRREIDGLRAVAVIPVVLFHAGFGIFGGGYVGVDVFFVISGYLITSILIAELERGDFSIIRFYERRARRILPALFFVMLVCVPFAWIWMAPSQLEDFGRSLVAVSLFASNILFWRESDYFAPAAEEKPLLHTWSLAVEEQYYMFFPLLLLLAWRFGRSRVFYLIAAIAAASLLLCEWGWREVPVATFYLAPTRAWELLAGSLCAFLQFGKEQKHDDLLAALGLGLIVFAIFVFDAATPFPSLYALVPVGGTALIILFAANGTWTARLLSNRSLVGIGLISYSLYLWHQPLFAFARIYSVHKPSQALMLCLALLSLVLSYLTWQYIEKPFRRKQRRSLPAASSMLTASAAAMILFLGAGVVTDAADGFYELKSTDRQLLLMRSATASPMRDDCHISDPNVEEPSVSCEYFSRNVKFATFGDSHAVELAYALAERLRGYDLGMRHLSLSECAPSYGKQRDGSDCSHWTDAPSTVLLATTRSTPLSSPIASMRTCLAAMRTAIPSCPWRSPRRKDGWYGICISVFFSISWNRARRWCLFCKRPSCRRGWKASSMTRCPPTRTCRVSRGIGGPDGPPTCDSTSRRSRLAS